MKYLLLLSFTLISFASKAQYVELSEKETKQMEKMVYEGIQNAYFHCDRIDKDGAHTELIHNVASTYKYYLQMGSTKVYLQKKSQPTLKFVFKSAITIQESFVSTNADMTVIESISLKSRTTQNNGKLDFDIDCKY